MNKAKNLKTGLHLVVMVTMVFSIAVIGIFVISNAADAGNIDIDVAPEAYPGDVITYQIDVTYPNLTGCSNDTLSIYFNFEGSNTSNLKVAPVNSADSSKLTLLSTTNSAVSWTYPFTCGLTEEFELTVKINNDVFIGVDIINHVRVYGNNGKLLLYESEATTRVVAPVLNVIKSVDKPLANPSDTLTYTVTVSNTGNAPATYVELVDTLPAGLTFTNEDGSNSGETEKILGTWDTLEAEATADFKYDVLIDSSAGVGTYTNTAIATSYENENDKTTVIAASEPATASTEVKIPVILGDEAPSLTVEKSVTESFVNPGGNATYTVIVTNDGTAPALNVILNDVLPTGFIFVDTGETTATWNLNDIVPTESVTKTYDVKVDASMLAGKYTNTATVSADDVDALTAQAELEVKEVQVLGAEEEVVLPTTGGGLALIISGLMLAGAGIGLRRKIQ